MEHDRRGVVAMEREVGLRGRLAEAYVRCAPRGIRLAYLLTGDRIVARGPGPGGVRPVRRPAQIPPRPGCLRAVPTAHDRESVEEHFRRRAVERAYLEREGPRAEDVSTDPDVATHDSLRSALLRLPLRQRSAVVLRYFEDLPDATIAELLGCRQATVRSLVARGLHALRTTPEVIS